jgi:hypothetical protein
MVVSRRNAGDNNEKKNIVSEMAENQREKDLGRV